MTRALPAAAALLLATTAATARPCEIERRTYPFFATRLTIEVHAGSPGALEVLRGGRGRIEVAGCADRAILGTAPPRAPGEPLRLTAVGGDDVRWLVIIPAGVHVTVDLPGRGIVPVRTGIVERYTWHARAARGPHAPAADRPPAGTSAAATSATPSDDRGPGDARPRAGGIRPVGATRGTALTYHDRGVPEVVDIDLANIRSISVRLEGEGFRVGTSLPMELVRGDPRRVAIRTDVPIDVVLYLPPDAGRFDLRAEGVDILGVRHGTVTTGCAPVTIQRGTDGVRRYDFVPIDGSLAC
jgi:hypothetical protein